MPSSVRCPECGGQMVRQVLDYTVRHDRYRLIIEQMPVWQCETCDTIRLSDDQLAHQREILGLLDLHVREMRRVHYL